VAVSFVSLGRGWEVTDLRDRNVTHYSYFGAFRSSVSNVGPNAAMLTQNGELTDIGSWYMGGRATNNVPKESGASRGLSSVIAAFTDLSTWQCLLLPFLVVEMLY
jgi:hypothetical protein